MSVSELLKNLDGDVTIPDFLDEIAGVYPDHVFVSIPVDDKNPDLGWEDVTFRRLTQAIDMAASWLLGELGRQSDSAEAIHFLVPQDLGLVILMLASAKLGYKGIFCHPRCTAESQTSINIKMKAEILIASGTLEAEARASIQTLLSAKPRFTVIAAPPLEFWLEARPLRRRLHLATATSQAAAKKPLAVIHSSGSTASPKPVVITHHHMLRMASSFLTTNQAAHVNYTRFRGRRVAVLGPVSSAAGLFLLLGVNLTHGFTSVLPPAPGPMSALKFEATIRYANVTSAVAPPKIFPDVMASSQMLEMIRDRIDIIGYIGAACPEHIGEGLRRHTQLCPMYGSTESGLYPILTADASDWAYMKYDSSFVHEMRPIALSCQYHQLVLPRDPSVRGFQIAFDLFPGVGEWRTNDVFVRHPDPAKADHWRFVGRMEDMITDDSLDASTVDSESASSPLIPNEMEHLMERHPKVSSAVICQNREGRLRVVLEPVGLGQPPATRPWGQDETQTYLDEIWSSVEEANAICPTLARIHRDGVLVASELFPRGTKGYPQRAFVSRRYRKDFDATGSGSHEAPLRGA